MKLVHELRADDMMGRTGALHSMPELEQAWHFARDNPPGMT